MLINSLRELPRYSDMIWTKAGRSNDSISTLHAREILLRLFRVETSEQRMFDDSGGFTLCLSFRSNTIPIPFFSEIIPFFRIDFRLDSSKSSRFVDFTLSSRQIRGECSAVQSQNHSIDCLVC